MFKPEAVKRSGLGLELGSVELVYDHPNGERGPAQDGQELLVKGRGAHAPVHYKEQQVRFPDCGFHLLQNLCRNDFRGIGDHAARVNDLHGRSAPVQHPINAIPRDAGLVPHDRLSLAAQAVEEGGLSYIGPSHDHRTGAALLRDPRPRRGHGFTRRSQGATKSMNETTDEHGSKLKIFRGLERNFPRSPEGVAHSGGRASNTQSTLEACAPGGGTLVAATPRRVNPSNP